LLSATSTLPVPSWALSMDKVAHAGLYSILGATLGYGKRYSIPTPPHWLPIGLGVLYGASDEWHQSFVRNRTPDFGDWLADVTGVTLGYAGLLLFVAWLASRKQPLEKGSDVSQ